MLKDKRLEAGLSQQKLADKSGVPLRTIQHWEAGNIEQALVGNLKKVADVLGTTVDSLI